jgi:tRNA (cytidine/uridine-2'-O-)-methyltransferase
MGFELDDRRLRRAGLDYHEWARVKTYPNLDALMKNAGHNRLYAITTKGRTGHHEVSYEDGDMLLFGPETRGLPAAVLDPMPESEKIRIPMLSNSRSLNLSNAVAVVLYEAWRQLGFGEGR